MKSIVVLKSEYAPGMAAESPEQKNANFLKPKKRPTEALFGLLKMAFFVRTCSVQPELGPQKTAYSTE